MSRAIPLEEVSDLKELYDRIVEVREHLNRFTPEWAGAQPDCPRSGPIPGGGYGIAPSLDSWAAYNRAEVADEYRDWLRLQAMRLWDPSLPQPPAQIAHSERDICDVLLPWVMECLAMQDQDAPVSAARSEQAMSPDQLIIEFERLSEIDPQMRIDRTRVGEVQTVTLRGWLTPHSLRRFRLLASDAAARLKLEEASSEVEPWLRKVLEAVPELVERHASRAECDDGRVVEFVAETIHNAAAASALAMKRCSADDEEPEADALPAKGVIPKREPNPGRETKPEYLGNAAKWFGFKHRQTLENAIADGTVAARQRSPRLWLFDLDEVQVDADAEPR